MKYIKNIIAIILVCTFFTTVIACGKGKKATTVTTQNQAITQNAQANNASPETQVTTQGSATNNATTPAATQSVATTGEPAAQNNDKPVETQSDNTESNEPNTQAPAKSGVLSVSYTTPSEQIVYYPAALESDNKKYPVLAWANGTGCTPNLYTDLLQQIAEGGYIVIANYETMAADGTAQINSIDLMLSENNNSGSVFYGKINTNKIGAIGHSQGGRSSVNAAVKDSRIDCVLSLAGSNFPEEAQPLKTPTLFIAGTNDMIVDPASWIVPAYDICQGPAVYASLSGAVHTTCCSDAQKYSYYAIKWFDAWLKGDSSAKAIFQNGGQLSQDTNWVDFACKGM